MSYILYNEKFQPIVKPGEYIAIPVDASYNKFRFYRVKTIFPVPRLYIPIVPRENPKVTMLEVGKETFIEDPYEMKTDENELMHTRVKYINFPIEVAFAKGGRHLRFTTYSKSHLFIGPGTPEEYTELFWGLGSTYIIIARPIFNFSIPFDGTYIRVDKIYMVLYGYRYIVEEVSEKPDKYTIIPFEPTSR